MWRKNPVKKISIIIPNYNSQEWIIKLFQSIDNQTFTDFEVIIVDDISTDGSFEYCKQYARDRSNVTVVQNKVKRYNGGTRNAGVELAEGEYIVFIDCDDWFYEKRSLLNIAEIIDKTHADLIRLSYTYQMQKGLGAVIFDEKDIETITHSLFVAPWTKCIKRELFVPFPENTLLEDVVQHIAQCDVIESVALCTEPIAVWNRTNENAISADKRVYTRDSKRYSSLYRNIADLIDLKVNHEYCKDEREKRIEWYLDKVHHAKEDTVIKVK